MEPLHCQHCQTKLLPITLPDGSGWEGEVHWVCFNDECAYFQEGWAWMWEHYRAKASYRYRVVNATTGLTSPLAVWSFTALRDLIVEDPT